MSGGAIARPNLQTPRAHIRLADAADAPLLLQYRLENQVHLSPWEPLRPSEYFTLSHCERTIAEGGCRPVRIARTR